jgi:hypothetical protein
MPALPACYQGPAAAGDIGSDESDAAVDEAMNQIRPRRK